MSRKEPKKDWITIDDMEDEFQISKQLQATWRMKKILPYVRIKNTVRYNRAKIEQFFKDAEVK